MLRSECHDKLKRQSSKAARRWNSNVIILCRCACDDAEVPVACWTIPSPLPPSLLPPEAFVYAHTWSVSGLKVVSSYSYQGTSYLLLQTLAVGPFVCCGIYRSATKQIEKPNRRNFRVWNSHGERIPDVKLSAVRFWSYTIHRTQYDRPS